MKRKSKLVKNYSGPQTSKLACLVLELSPGMRHRVQKPYLLLVVPSQARVYDLLVEVNRLGKSKETDGGYLIGNGIVLNPTTTVG